MITPLVDSLVFPFSDCRLPSTSLSYMGSSVTLYMVLGFRLRKTVVVVLPETCSCLHVRKKTKTQSITQGPLNNRFWLIAGQRSYHFLLCSRLRDVEDLVVSRISISVIPADGEGAGGWVRYLQILNSTQWFCRNERSSTTTTSSSNNIWSLIWWRLEPNLAEAVSTFPQKEPKINRQWYNVDKRV